MDFGNSCWTFEHYSYSIQTLEYKGIETILRFDYNEKADIWSLACMVYELITGVYLFRPKENNGVSKEEDLLALMTETLGPIP